MDELEGITIRGVEICITLVLIERAIYVNRHLIKFQQLLRELFQFDCADLDFGIYRIMNRKRGIIEHFIAKDLPKTISTGLE